jgi:hypothetical protein
VWPLAGALVVSVSPGDDLLKSKIGQIVDVPGLPLFGQ